MADDVQWDEETEITPTGDAMDTRIDIAASPSDVPTGGAGHWPIPLPTPRHTDTDCPNLINPQRFNATLLLGWIL